MCTGRLDPSFPLEGLAKGADGIFVGGCHPGECHYQDGNYHALVTAALVHETAGAARRQPRAVPHRLGLGRGRTELCQDHHRLHQTGGRTWPPGQGRGQGRRQLRRELAQAAEAARERRLRTGLINASREMMKNRDFSRPTIAALVKDKCAKALDGLGREVSIDV